MNPGFVLITYIVRHRHRNDCHEGLGFYSQFPKNKRQATPHQAKGGNIRWSEGREKERKMWQESLPWFLPGKKWARWG